VKRSNNIVVTVFLVLAVVCGPKSQNDFIVPGVDLYHLPRDAAEVSATVDKGEAQPVEVTTAKPSPTEASIHFKQGAWAVFVTTAPVVFKNTTEISQKDLRHNDLKYPIPMRLRL
jgi:hypothetical protein